MNTNFPSFVAVAVGKFDDVPRVATHVYRATDDASIVAFNNNAAWFGDVTKDLQRDRQVVRNEVPERVDVPARARPVGANGLDAANHTDFSGCRDRCKRLDARVIAPDVADKNAIRGNRRKPFGVSKVRGEWFL